MVGEKNKLCHLRIASRGSELYCIPGRSQVSGAFCTLCPGMPGSAFRRACRPHSAFAHGKLRHPLPKLAPWITQCVLVNSILLMPVRNSARKIKYLAQSIPLHLCACNELWELALKHTEVREVVLLEVSPPGLGSEAVENEEVQAREMSWETWRILFPLGFWVETGESVMYYFEIRDQLSLDFLWRNSSCHLDMN